MLRFIRRPFHTRRQLWAIIWWLADGNVSKPLHANAVELIALAEDHARGRS